MNKDDILVSISCLAYNHEKYIRQALDGFIMQKTNFKYEVLIHDDASTDGTADIIREYEKKYPDIIKPIYQKENQYSQGVKFSWTYQYPRAKGKYITFCEGDDYWTDENKLQQQIDIMEQYDNVTFCSHLVNCVNEDGTPNERTYPINTIKEGLLKADELLERIIKKNEYPFQTSSYCIRSCILKQYDNKVLPDFIRLSMAGSINLMILCAKFGDAYYIDKEMSAYRLNSIGSWSEQQKNVKNKCNHLKSWNESRKALDSFLDYKWSKSIKKQVLNNEFLIFRLERKYRKCLAFKFWSQYKKLSIKETVYIILHAILGK